MNGIVLPANPPIEQMHCECLVEVAQHCPRHILPDAIAWWRDHYTRTFKKAIDNGLIWSDWRDGVLDRARVLGDTAQRLADASGGRVDAAVAERASAEVDCLPAVREAWCNP